MTKTKLLLTGGTGFIGHHTVDYALRNYPDLEIWILDRMSYAGNLNFLADLPIWEKEKHRVHIVWHDIRSEVSEMTLKLLPDDIDWFIHMAAETHVDRSIVDPYPFVMTNVVGTLNMLDLARKLCVGRMDLVSTDEVFGPAQHGHLHKEEEAIHPSNPYSASKAGAEALAYAYYNTYGVPVLITNTMNNFGERQHWEKFIPKTVKAILGGLPVTIHCKKDEFGHILDVSSRCWLHAKVHGAALLWLMEHGEAGQHYNVVGEWATVEDIANLIGNILGCPVIKNFEDFHSFRPGHDMHYGLDGTKLASMGWKPPVEFLRSLTETVLWMRDNPKWLG